MKKLLLIYQKIYIEGKKRKQTSNSVVARDRRRLQARTDVAVLAELFWLSPSWRGLPLGPSGS